MTSKELNILLEGCKQKNTSSQKKLFMHMYNYGMTIAQQYASNLQEAEEIANDGFFKVLKNIKAYKNEGPFLLWVRRIIINCAIDHFRKHSKKDSPVSRSMSTIKNNADEKFDVDYLTGMIQQLTPRYRMVFVLHVVEGYSHDEIANQLNITKGTSKSNLSKAKKKLQEMITLYNQNMSQYGR